MAALTSSVVQSGWAWRTSAAMPATCGDAIEVPESTYPRFPVPEAVDRMLTPGAAMSGLSALSPVRGPPELKLAKPVNPGLVRVIAVVEAVSAARSATASGLVGGPKMPRNGMVTVNGIPVSGFERIGPSNGGKLATLLIIATAAAPACWPKTARATRAHTPRSVTASWLPPATIPLLV